MVKIDFKMIKTATNILSLLGVQGKKLVYFQTIPIFQFNK